MSSETNQACQLYQTHRLHQTTNPYKTRHEETRQSKTTRRLALNGSKQGTKMSTTPQTRDNFTYFTTNRGREVGASDFQKNTLSFLPLHLISLTPPPTFSVSPLPSFGFVIDCQRFTTKESTTPDYTAVFLILNLVTLSFAFGCLCFAFLQLSV